ncbi:MAG: nucleotidyltransferase domain-containing protein [Bacteroidota bacterium]
MSINGQLTRFSREELVLGRKARERNDINRSLDHLEKILKDQLRDEVQSFLRFGSYTRNTILPRQYDPGSDIDLMVVMNTKDRELQPGTYRKKLLDVISQAYPNSLSQKDFPAVKLELKSIKFDLVPAVCETSWWGSKTYYIPDARDTWQETVPNDINEKLGQVNEAIGGNIFRNVIRLCKHWNSTRSRPKLPSYLMEKKILNLSAWFYWKNTYEGFMDSLDLVAGDQAGVRDAMRWIREYEGNGWREPNEAKQLQWLRKLLPKLG